VISAHGTWGKPNPFEHQEFPVTTTGINSITDMNRDSDAPVRAPYRLPSGAMSDAPAPEPVTYSTITFITTNGETAGSWDVASGGDAFGRVHLAGMWVSLRTGIPIERLVPTGEHRILGRPSLWAYEHFRGEEDSWMYRGPIHYRRYADEAMTAADMAKSKARVRATISGNLVFTEAPAEVRGFPGNPRIVFEEL
jgi:hypothetical protein